MNTTKYTGQDLIDLGCEQGPVIGELLSVVNTSPHTRDEVRALIKQKAPAAVLPLLSEPAPCQYNITCLLYTSPSPRDLSTSRMPSSA